MKQYISTNTDKEQRLSSPDELEVEKIFEQIVSKSYLQDLCSLKTVPFNEQEQALVINTKMKWIKISKLVFEKNVFFADKLSMLYTALHPVSSQVVLLLRKHDYLFDLYLGTRDNLNEGSNYGISRETLMKGIQGYLPGIHFEVVNEDIKIECSEYVSCVSGVAALKDDKKENFIQGLERLINSTMSIKNYTALIIADKISNSELNNIKFAYEDLFSALSPLSQNQLTYSENNSYGVNSSVSKGFSFSTSKSVSNTITRGTSWSKSHSVSNTKTERGWSLTPFGVGLNKAGDSETTNDQNQKGGHEDNSHQDGKQTQKGEEKTHQNGRSYEWSKGMTSQITFENKHVKDYQEILEKNLKRLISSEPYGAWSCATYFLSDTETETRALSGIYKGCIVGDDSDVEISAINYWNNNAELRKYLINAIHPQFYIGDLKVTAGSLVNSKELGIHLSLPLSSVPGILVKEQAAFGRNVISSDNDSSFSIGHIMHLGEVYKNIVNLNMDTLSKHTFVTGTTGSGKSNTLYLMLNSLREAEKHFLVIEPVKGEYKKIFGGYDDVNVFGCIPQNDKMLKLNPFSFPEDIHVYEHIDSLVEIFNACWPMYAAMPVVLKHAIEEAYRKCGWDMDNSANPFKLYPTIVDVKECLNEFMDQSQYSGDTRSDYKGALETRLVSLSEGLNKRMFCSTDPIKDEDLFDRNVIIDLSHLGSTETKALIMGLLILKLKEYRMATAKEMNTTLQHVTVLEEAHNLLKRVDKSQSQEAANLAGKSVEMITNGIAEMRTYGEGFIIADQSPSMLDLAAIRNTNTKIVLALPEAEDREVAGKAMGLKDEQINEISKLKNGEAIVYQNDWEEPVICKIDLFQSSATDYIPEKTNIFVSNNDVDLDIVKFMVAGRLQSMPPINIEQLEVKILRSSIFSRGKFILLSALKEFEQNGVSSLWENRNFTKLSSMVTDYIGINDEFSDYIKYKGDDISKLSENLEYAVDEKLNLNNEKELTETLVQCVLRYMSIKSNDIKQTYIDWYKFKKSKR